MLNELNILFNNFIKRLNKISLINKTKVKMEQSSIETRMLSFKTSLQFFAYSLTRNAENANDLVQETYLKAFLYNYQYRTDSNLKAWLFKIMKNIFINNYRKE